MKISNFHGITELVKKQLELEPWIYPIPKCMQLIMSINTQSKPRLCSDEIQFNAKFR